MAERKTFSDTGKQMKPCIMAKATHALGVTEKTPSNTTRCKPDTWARTVKEMAKHHGITSETEIAEAIRKYEEYIFKKG